jgi:hypothetical protein
MYTLTTIAELIKRVKRKRELLTCAMAGMLFLAAASVRATAQTTNTYTGTTVVHAGTIGIGPGQRVTVTVPNYYFQDGSVRFLKHTIRVYNVTERESGLVYSGESGGMAEHELGHIFTIAYGDLKVSGEPSTGRVQIWIEIESFPPTGGLLNAQVVAPTFELIDESNGKTTVLEPAGPMKESMETMKKAWKDASSTPEGTKQ